MVTTKEQEAPVERRRQTTHRGPVPKRGLRRDEREFCPHCGAEARNDAIRCERCAFEIGAARIRRLIA